MTDPLPPVVFDTLETILAPGKRARLSPFVESAQFAVLFDEIPNDQAQAESCAAILGQRRHAERIGQIAANWDRFVQTGKDFSANDYTDPDFLDAYLAYYFSVNVPKVQLVLLDLARLGRLTGAISLVDIGVGTGTTAVAALDFLLAWGHVCDLYGATLPVTGLALVGIDRSRGSLSQAVRVVGAYIDALRRRLANRPTGEPGSVTDRTEVQPDILERVADWGSACAWYLCDLGETVPRPNEQSNLVVLGNVLNELSRTGLANLETFLQSHLAEEALLNVIEPGAQADSMRLMKWRRDLVNSGSGFVADGPCGQEFGAELPASCQTCWNSRRESFHQSALYRAFCEASLNLSGNQSRFDQFENKLLSWSYSILRKEASPPLPSQPTCDPLRDGVTLRDPVDLRYIGSYRGKEPVSYDPDDFRTSRARKARHTDEDPWNEYLKMCPASYGVSGIVFERPPGFQTPPSRYGQWLSVGPVVVRAQRDGVFKLLPKADEPTIFNGPIPDERVDEFLPQYDDRARRAVDELAYRLFGFSEMSSFQHQIIGRVLTGQAILGIAATGGGKSECFILPAMLLPGLTIVISPLKSLMADQYEQRIRRRYGLDHLTTYINGDVPFHERQARLQRMALGYYKLVYFTPEQLERGWVLDSLRRANETVGIRYLAMDEAHCISQWGHDFRPAYLNISRRFQRYGLHPVRIALTATASPNVRADICEELGLSPGPLDEGGDVFIESSNRPELNLIVRVRMSTEDKMSDIVADLQELLLNNERNDAPGAAIVFMPWTGGNPDMAAWSGGPNEGRLSAGVTGFAHYLEKRFDQRVAIYHSKMDSDEADTKPEDTVDARPETESKRVPGDLRGRTRQGEQNAFIEGQRAIMVATKGFGMGIDKSNIRFVVHRSPPINLEAYAQEAGRAGRDGQLANVILYYSPDSPDDDDGFGGKHSIPSDYEIQRFFLSMRYVRREDIVVMRAFLRNVTNRIGENLYFTNDEALDFFERCAGDGQLAGLTQLYAWPEFSKLGTAAFGEHRSILERGHLYKEKTDYLNRILQAMYRIRPTVDGRPRLALLEQAHETGARVIDPKVLLPERILFSNSYFGACLRQAGFTESELAEWLARPNLLPLAERLRLPLREVCSLLQDIRSADGNFTGSGPHRRWKPALLDFKAIVPPRWGPAAGLDQLPAWRQLAAWREYAGAERRASKREADERACKVGRRRKKEIGGKVKWVPDPSLDDWFYWPELNRSRGWEVQPGPALHDDASFARYLDAFMSAHDDREKNDWEAYHRLLTDYIGVSRDGGILRSTRPATCLRAVLLGYLKSHEVVTGGNCHSCSRCVPEERFETSLEERRRVVVRLGPRIEALLDQVESYAQQAPPELLINILFRVVRDEEAHARSLRDYLTGWSGRLLQDTPDHRGALWIRLRGMVEGLLVAEAEEFVANSERLAQLTILGPATTLDSAALGEAARLEHLLAAAGDLAPDDPRLYAIRARLCERLGRPADEETAWLAYVEAIRRLSGPGDPRLICAYSRLRDLTARGESLADAARNEEYRLLLARFNQDANGARAAYAPLVGEWDWQRVTVEIAACADEARPAGVALGLLMAWAEFTNPVGKSNISDRVNWVVAYLDSTGRAIVRNATRADLRLLAICLGIRAIARRAELAAQCGRAILQLGSEAEDLRNGSVLCLAAMRSQAMSEDQAIRIIASAIIDSPDCWAAARAIRPAFENHDQLAARLLVEVEPVLHRTTIADWAHWFQAFPPAVHLAAPQGLLLTIFQAAASIFTSLKEPAWTPEAQIALTALQVIADPSIDAQAGPQLHKLWLDLCRVQPGRLGDYFHRCLEQSAPRSDLAEEVFEMLLKSGVTAWIRPALEWLAIQSPERLSRRLARASEFFRLMQQYVEVQRGVSFDSRSDALGEDSLVALRRVFIPEQSAERADILAAATRFFRVTANRHWPAAAELEVESLRLAGQFEDAAQLLDEYPELRTAPLASFGEDGTRPAASRRAKYDYRRICRTCFSNFRVVQVNEPTHQETAGFVNRIIRRIGMRGGPSDSNGAARLGAGYSVVFIDDSGEPALDQALQKARAALQRRDARAVRAELPDGRCSLPFPLLHGFATKALANLFRSADGSWPRRDGW